MPMNPAHSPSGAHGAERAAQTQPGTAHNHRLPLPGTDLWPESPVLVIPSLTSSGSCVLRGRSNPSTAHSLWPGGDLCPSLFGAGTLGLATSINTPQSAQSFPSLAGFPAGRDQDNHPVCLFISLSIQPSSFLLIDPSIHLLIHPFIHPSINPSLHLPTCAFIHPSIRLSEMTQRRGERGGFFPYAKTEVLNKISAITHTMTKTFSSPHPQKDHQAWESSTEF